MGEYLAVFRSHANTFDTLSNGEIQRFNRKREQFWAEGRRDGWLLDASGALQTDGRVIHAHGHITNGPLVDRDDVARGYLKIKAESLDAAVEHVRGCPVLLHDGRVEIRPFFVGHPGK